MSDEETTLPEENSVAPTQDVDYQKRFTDTQAAYTKSQQELAAERGVWDDEQAALARLQERFPHLFEDEDDDTPEELDDEDDPVAPIRTELEQFKAWQAQVENERGAERFARDLKAELGDDAIPEKATDWIKDRTAALGNNPKALKQAVEEYRALADDIRGPTRKPAPTPPAPGKAGEPKYDPRNRDQRRARMAAAIEAANQQ